MTDDARAWQAFVRRRSGFHESGHGLLMFLLRGSPPDLLSIRPGQSYRAIAISAPIGGWVGGLDLDATSIVHPDGLRRMLETAISISLAGDLAAEMAGYREVGYAEPSDDETAAEVQAEALATLSPRRRELLAENEARPTSTPDAENARGASFALTGNVVESAAHLAWLRVVTQRLLIDHVDALTRLADALVAAEVMDGETFLPIAKSGRCRCHSWSQTQERKITAMPNLLSRKPKAGPAVYVATGSGIAQVGDAEVAFVAGRTRIRAGHPLLAVASTYFEPDPSGAGHLVEPEIIGAAEPAPKAPDEIVVATTTFPVSWMGRTMLVVQEGQRFERSHETVKRHPGNFRPETSGPDAA